MTHSTAATTTDMRTPVGHPMEMRYADTDHLFVLSPVEVYHLGKLTRELTEFDCFEALVTNNGRENGYRPTLRADLDPRYTVLADAYDAAQAGRGSALRAFRG